MTTAYLPEIFGSAVIGQTVRMTAFGTLPAVAGHAVVHQWQPMTAHGTLPEITGHAELTVTQRMVARGTLPAITGRAELYQRQSLSAHGILPAITGNARVQQTQAMQAAGTLPEIIGQATLGQRISMAAHGILPEITGACELRMSTHMTAHGILPEIISGSRVAMFSSVDPIFVMNAETTGISEYTLPWSYIVEHDGQVYGLSAAGLERLEGPIEATARPRVETGKIILAPGASCNVPSANVTLTADGAIVLSATADRAGHGVSMDYVLPRTTDVVPRQRRVKLGRGPVGEAWTFRLGPRAPGTNWENSELTVLVDRPRRR